jgi:predicted transcriptional regulator
MSTDISTEKRKIHKMFSAVFSQKPAASAKRIAILRAINNCVEEKMKFRDILREVQSGMKDLDYRSQKLTYDLRVLRENMLINQTWDGEYTITDKGCSLLAMYQEIEREVDEPEKRGKLGIVGEVNGQIRASMFDLNLLREELARLALFRKKFTPSKEKFCLEIKDDDDNFRSNIEIRKSGHFNVRVVLYHDYQEERRDFLSDFDQGDEWYETAKGIAQTVVYYIKRAVKKIWPDSEIDVPLKPDSYPI